MRKSLPHSAGLAAAGLIGCAWVSIALTGCSVDTQTLEDVGNRVENALIDPLDAKPFPTLVGGTTQTVYYATNLGDIRINLKDANDFVIPGFAGPSQLLANDSGKRDLLRPLVVSPSIPYLNSMASDGTNIAYIAYNPDLDGSSLVLGDVFGVYDQTVFTSTDGDQLNLFAGIQLDRGRLAYVESLRTDEASDDILHVLSTDDTITELYRVAVSGSIESYHLRGNLLATWERIPGDRPSYRLSVHDLMSGEISVLTETTWEAFDSPVFITDSKVVYSELVDVSSIRVLEYDLVTGLTGVWLDSVKGQLHGATDDYFITEAWENKSGAEARIVIRKVNSKGKVQSLADFRDNPTGYAGQSRIIGTKVAWVNPDRHIVLVHLTGGDRRIIKP